MPRLFFLPFYCPERRGRDIMRGMRGVRSKRRLWLLVVALALAITLAALFGRAVVSCVWSNAGALTYSRALVAAGDGAMAPDALAKAESLLVTALRLDGHNSAAHRLLGFVLWEQGHLDEAAAHWREGGIPLADFTRAASQARYAEHLEKALDWYSRAIAVAPAKSDAYASAAAILIAMDAEEQAFAYLDKAIALDDFASNSRRISARYNRGDLLRATGRYSEARAEYEWVLERKPNDYWAYIQLGGLAWEAEGDGAQAEAMYLRAVEISPNQKWGYRSLGSLYRDLGRTAEALQMYLKVLEIDPADDWVRKRVDALKAGESQ